jgi:hypothetical protein
MIDSGQLWSLMLNSDNAGLNHLKLGYLMTSSTPGEDRWSDSGNKPLEEGIGF